MKMGSTGTDCPGELEMPHPWKHSKSLWQWHLVEDDPPDSRWIGTGWSIKSLPIKTIVWFYKHHLRANLVTFQHSTMRLKRRMRMIISKAAPLYCRGQYKPGLGKIKRQMVRRSSRLQPAQEQLYTGCCYQQLPASSSQVKCWQIFQSPGD